MSDLTSCGICGLDSDLIDAENDEELMSVLLRWWMQEPVYEVPDHVAALEDMRSLLRHLADAGFWIVRPCTEEPP